MTHSTTDHTNSSSIVNRPDGSLQEQHSVNICHGQGVHTLGFRFRASMGSGGSQAFNSSRAAFLGQTVPVRHEISMPDFVGDYYLRHPNDIKDSPIGRADFRAAPQCSSLNCSPTSAIIDSFEQYQLNTTQATHRYESCVNWDSTPKCNGLTSPRSPLNDNRKIKTEMCRNMREKGFCVWGDKCLFAHSENERKTFTSVDEMHENGLVSTFDKEHFLNRPCLFFVSTGSCPYHSRCKSLHDPRISGDEEKYPSWLEHYTKYNKKEPSLILDRLHHHRVNSIHQEHPLIESFLWEQCRPSLLESCESDISFDEMFWNDTYRLVCNLNVPIMSPPMESANQAVSTYSNVLSRKSSKKISELQKLCIVLAMCKPSTISFGDHTIHLDFTYEPTHCINGQPCMILQCRFYRLLDFEQKNLISIHDVVEEISIREYQALSSNLTVRVSQLVMDSKGKRSANLSIFFDVDVTLCSNNKAKRISKKGEDHWQLDDKTLFCMPKNDVFSSNIPVVQPYVMMQPVADDVECHDLLEGIIEYRIGTILLTSGLNYAKFPLGKTELQKRLIELKSALARLTKAMKRTFWPKTMNMDHIKKTTEERNRTEYSPSNIDGQGSIAQGLWESFVLNLNVIDEPHRSTKRLPIFSSVSMKASLDDYLPHIKYKKPNTVPTAISSLSIATWKELLEDESGAWAAVMSIHEATDTPMHA